MPVQLLYNVLIGVYPVQPGRHARLSMSVLLLVQFVQAILWEKLCPELLLRFVAASRADATPKVQPVVLSHDEVEIASKDK